MLGRTRGLQGSVVGAGLAELFYNVKVIEAHGLSGPWEEDAESWHGKPGSLEVLQVALPLPKPFIWESTTCRLLRLWCL